MNVKTTVKFRDLKEGIVREVGDVFECTEKRYKEILKKGPFVEKVEDEAEPAEEPEAEAETEEEPAPKKTTRRTASKAAKAE